MTCRRFHVLLELNHGGWILAVCGWPSSQGPAYSVAKSVKATQEPARDNENQQWQFRLSVEGSSQGSSSGLGANKAHFVLNS